MDDRSLTHPQGIIEDVLVKVDKFIFPIDFVFLEMEEDKEASLILGRPFLAIEQALIDVKDGELTLRVGDDQVKFNFYRNLKFSGDDKVTCLRIDSLKPLRDKLIHEFMDEDPLEERLVFSLSVEELNDEKVASNLSLDETIMNLEENEDAMVVEEESQTPDALVLK